MNKVTLLISILLLSFTISAVQAAPTAEVKNHKPLSHKQIERMDKKHKKHKAKKRKFHNRKAFAKQHRYHPNTRNKHLHSQKYHHKYYEDSFIYFYDDRAMRQRGYRYSKRGWELAYRYDRAAFFDRYGYHYGYFNRHGYYFEGIFYRYDRGYTFRDRVKGRGLFDHRYYMPADADYYGLSRHPSRGF